MTINVKACVVITLYMIITVGIALFYARKEIKTNEDFSVGGRRFGSIVLFFTMLATMVGASSVVGATGWYWTNGLSQGWLAIGVPIAFFIFVIYLGPRINRFGFKKNGETVGDWLEYRYGSSVRYISAVLMIVSYFAITAFQYMAMANIFGLITGLNFTISLLITALVVTLYTSLGGFWAVAYTDVIQGIMTLLGVILLIPIVISKAGGFGNIIQSVPPEHLKLTGHVTPMAGFSYALVFLLSIVSWPDVWQRCYAAKDEKTLRKTLKLYIVASLILSLVGVAILGIGARAIYPTFDTPENILPFMILDLMPGIIGPIFLSSIIAIVMGTADSTLLVTIIMFEKDLFLKIKPNASDEERIKIKKGFTFFGSIIIMILALTASSMFDILIWSCDILGATLAVPILLGMQWRKPGNLAGIVSIGTGFIGWLLAQMGVVALQPILLGVIFSLIGYVAAAYAKPNTETKELY